MRTGQLNRTHAYGDVEDNQLRTLNHIGLFATDIGGQYEDYLKLPGPFDASLPLEERARSYLDANCAQCHRPGGSGRVDIDLRFEVPLETTGLIGVPTLLGSAPGAPTQRVFAGDPGRSSVFLRMLSLDENRMPPLATSRIDEEGVDLMRRWILALSTTHTTESASPQPQSFELQQNFPNPFNATTQIAYRLRQDAFVTLTVYDLLGRRIRQLVRRYQVAGAHATEWDGADDGHHPVASGVYVYRLKAGNAVTARKMALIK